MVRPREIVSQGLAGVFPDKDSPGVADLRHDLEGIPGDDLQMLGGNLVGRFDGFLQVLCDEDIAVIRQGFLQNLSSGKGF